MKNHDKLIREQESDRAFLEMMRLRVIRQIVYQTLVEKKGFHQMEVHIDPQFSLELQACVVGLSTDFMIVLEGTIFMVIRCVPSDIESWERSVVAFARAIKDYQIPFAVITDGGQVKEIDIIKNVSVQKSIQELISRQEASRFMRDFRKIPIPNNKIEKERRIICAFEDIKRSMAID